MTLIYTDSSGGKLFQAGKSEIPGILAKNNISILILAAEEYQPRDFIEVVKYYIPLDDNDRMTLEEFKDIKRIAFLAALSIHNGGEVLSTCHQGRNRSGIISALILKYLTKCKGPQVIKHIKSQRRNALTNNFFNELIILDDYRKNYHHSQSRTSN